jgi:HK97 family phage portal protein
MFKTIFGNKTPPLNVTQYKMLNDFIPFFSAFDGDLYDSDIVRTCIDAIARNAAKLKPKHIRRINGEIVKTQSLLERLLQVRPNEYMNTYDFLYKVVSQLYSNNNAFIYIQSDMGTITGLYPINFSSIEPVEYQGELYCRFTFKTGFRMTVPYTDLIHIRRHFNRDDIFGEDGRKPFKTTLNLIQTINQGLVNAIKSSARLRGWLKFTQTLRPEDIKAQRDQFVKDYLSIDNDGGIGAIDAKAEFTPANMDAKMADDKQMGIVRENVYRYFGVNEKIIQSTYNEDEWGAFYESVIEPIAIQLSLEFTAKCFTGRELGFGNEIIFEANRLQYASAKTKTTLIKELLPMELLSINDALEILNMPPIEGGERRLRSLNYIDASIANEYQMKGVKPIEEGNPDGGTEGND